jgi:anti-sigma factor RsiW
MVTVGIVELRHCSDVREALSASIDGEASPADLDAAARHLGRCPRCRRFAAEVTALTHMLRSTPPGRPSPTTWSPDR